MVRHPGPLAHRLARDEWRPSGPSWATRPAVDPCGSCDRARPSELHGPLPPRPSRTAPSSATLRPAASRPPARPPPPRPARRRSGDDAAGRSGPLPPTRRPALVGRRRPGPRPPARRGSWGIGDLADVRELAALAARPRRRVPGPQPPARARRRWPPIATSPYSPSSRRWRSPLLLRVDELAGGDPAVDARWRAQARALLADPHIDRDACWSLQRQALELLWGRSTEPRTGTRSPRGAPSRALRSRAGRASAPSPSSTGRAGASGHSSSVIQTLRPSSEPRSALADRSPSTPGCSCCSTDQLDAARAVGPRLVQDLAVGVDPDGADAWLWQDLLADGFSIGAPPDDFEPDGQRWGLPPWIPGRLRDARLPPARRPPARVARRRRRASASTT